MDADGDRRMTDQFVGQSGENLAALLRIDPTSLSRGPFADGYEAAIDVGHLARALDGVDVGNWPDVPPKAVRTRQIEFIAGRLCAEAVLRALGCPAAVRRDGQGRPVWPERVTGSITHGGGIALAVAVSRRGRFDIGIDAERLIEQASTQRAVRDQCLAEGEHARDVFELTAIFCAKEAYYKAVNRAVQRFVGFGEVRCEWLNELAGVKGPRQWLRLIPVSAGDLPEAIAWLQLCEGRVIARIGP